MNLRHALATLRDRSPREWAVRVRERMTRTQPLTGFGPGVPCVFVLSTGRVGTQTLAALAGLADDLVAMHEPAPKLFGLSRLAYEHWHDAAARAVLIEATRTTRAELLDGALRARRGYVETSPQVTFLAPALAEVVPTARFVHLIRDPRHVVRSGMRREWYAGSPADRHRIVPQGTSPAREAWETMTPLERNAWSWSETNLWIQRFCATLPPDRSVVLRAEEVFGGQAAALHDLFATLERTTPRVAALERILGKQLNAQTRGDFPAANEWDDGMRTQLRRWAGEAAARFGYGL